MPATQEISDKLIRENINRAVIDVFRTMVSHEVVLSDDPGQGRIDHIAEPQAIGDGATCRPQVVGTVGFLGEANGLIYLYLDDAFARELTGHMLGMSPEEVEEAGDEVVNDAIGELTNMSVGSFKNGLCDAGFPCKLTIPSILRGSNFTVEPISSAQRYVYRFRSGDHRVVADILLKQGELSE